ncbi:hypothetical protein [Glutamicibacter uratoxydans]|uniref:hypothetical protein n=1 Tax=Glutamicibacter uratoxydans TaxID=43667 RepID=UPI003D6EC89F
MDSRFPTYYLQDRRVLKATPTAFRLYVVGTAWSVSNMTDGVIPEDDFPLIPLAQPHDAAELVKLGLWAKAADGWQVIDFMKTQTSAAQMETALENRRKADRERQAKARARKKSEQEESPSDIQTSRDGHVTSEGRGKAEAEAEARTIEPPHSENEVDTETGEVFSPPKIPSNNPWANIPMADQSNNQSSSELSPMERFRAEAARRNAS